MFITHQLRTLSTIWSVRISRRLWPGPRVSAQWGCPWHLGPSLWPQKETWSFLPQSPGGRTDTHRWLITRPAVCRGPGHRVSDAVLYFEQQINLLTGFKRAHGEHADWSCQYFIDNHKIERWWSLWEILRRRSDSVSHFEALSPHL